MIIRTRSPYFRLMDDLLHEARPWLSGGEHGKRMPAIDVDETASAYSVRANLPGFAQDEISVNIHDDVLTIAGESAAETASEGSRALIRERRQGKFSRSLRFPVAVDGEAVAACFEDGVLSISLPKADHVQPRQIPVTVSGASA